MSDVTSILSRIQTGDGQAAEELLPVVYEELRRLAAQRLLRESPGQTLQATALVHEAYLRLVGSDVNWEGNSHFFAAAAEAMRRILVDRARAKKASKRGGDRQRVDLHQTAIQASNPDAANEVLVVNELLDRLAENRPDEAAVVKLRYFGDLNISEAAKALGIPVSTAHKRWNFARAWLRCELQKDEAD